MNGDLLDEYCDQMFGHTDWQMHWDKEGNLIVTFFEKARPDWLELNEENEECMDDGDEMILAVKWINAEIEKLNEGNKK